MDGLVNCLVDVWGNDLEGIGRAFVKFVSILVNLDIFYIFGRRIES